MRPRKTINQINVVPYIDVMLVLLVIFMVTAPLVAPSAIDLPSVGQPASVPASPLQVRVYRDGTVTFRDAQSGGRETARLSVNDLVARVTERQTPGNPQPIVIEADRNVQYDQVVTVLDALKRAGAQKVGLLVKQAR
ncbi:MAG: ExbD/TolR family protein [Pseudomonadota bacterium]|nr:ExbD/TolR family protein [Pseudomonadota bacterium]